MTSVSNARSITKASCIAATGRHTGSMFSRHKTLMSSAAEALPGRTSEMPVPARHLVKDAPLQPPFPEGFETAVFGMGCFWGAERKFWEADGVYTTAVGYAGGFTPNPTYNEVCSGRTGHTEAVLVAFDPALTSYAAVLKTFWESHDPTQGMRQGNDRRHPVPVRDLRHLGGPAQSGPRVARHIPGAAHRGRPGRDHHRDPGGARLLLRRGLPPAVPGPEPQRLLRPGRHRRELPHRPGDLTGARCRGLNRTTSNRPI